MTKPEDRKTGKNCGNSGMRDGALRGQTRCLRLPRSEGRQQALSAARGPEGCATHRQQLRHIDLGRQPVATIPKPRTEVELGSASPAAEQLAGHR